MAQPLAKKRKTASGVEGSTISDARFANIQSDPRYRLPGKKHRVKADKRFARALQDDDFTRTSRVDRYGRPVNADAEKQRLKRRYEFDGESEDDSDDPDDDDEVQKELNRVDQARDLLREGKDVSSSEDESSSAEDSELEADVDDDESGAGATESDVILGEVSSRLAVVNLDWDNIRAEDLMAVFTSFLPPTGKLLSVAVYPSEFGRERMEREELEGPPKEIFAAEKADAGEDSESEQDDNEIEAEIMKPDDGSEFDSTALRQYQLDRLRYYYAVMTFSSTGTAKAIYDAVDGTEYLSTANFFDLRFVPDETDFTTDTPREQCSGIPPGYKPNDFVTDALQHSKVKLTWDAEDGSRKEAQARAFRGSRKDIDENDLKAYLASDTEDEQEDSEAENLANPEGPKLSKKEAERQRMRALLGLSAEPLAKSKRSKDAPTGNIQITFSSGLSGPINNSDDESDNGAKVKRKSKRSVFENSPELEETTMEKYIRKEKERKQRRKEKMKSTKTGDTEEVEATVHSDQSENDLGFDDPFFAEPTHDAKSVNKIRKEERLKKKKEREAEEATTARHRAELELLMADDAAANGTSKGRTVKHFDMDEIIKAEKAASKKKIKAQNKSKTAARANTTAADDFTINTADPRFANLYDHHEFAIDPSDPRFKKAKGMKALVDEGRRRKTRDVHRHPGQDRKRQGPEGDLSTKSNHVNPDDMSSLVEKIKRKSKAG